MEHGHPLASSHLRTLLPCGSSLGRNPSGCNQFVLSGTQESFTSMGCDQSTVLGVVSMSEFKLAS